MNSESAKNSNNYTTTRRRSGAARCNTKNYSVLPCDKFLRLLIYIYLILLFTLFSCASQKLPARELPIERDGVQIAMVNAEIARSEEEKSQGLMHRKELADGDGMFFIYERDQVLSFWMKNTYIPLSIAFIASDGRIIDIKDMHPHDENSVRSSRSVRYALEVPQGWFTRAGINPGDFVNINNIN
ncbi:MAG: DUF192 domain-containing protein [Treponema sp.]|nr:DUF192 domain-containing protein [Treponema sp.]